MSDTPKMDWYQLEPGIVFKSNYKANTIDVELKCWGTHYVLEEAIPVREDNREQRNELRDKYQHRVDNIVAMMKHAAQGMIGGLKVAKP
jgi:hypothetical protein